MITRGFGVVRVLTTHSQQEVFRLLDEGDVSDERLSRRPPLHTTILNFIGMSKREQAMFHAGFNVARLEEKLEQGVELTAPRRCFSVQLGAVAAIDSYLYCPIESPELDHEQLQLAGQVALHGISPSKIDKKVIPVHMGIGHVQGGHIEQVREDTEAALQGAYIGLQKWVVYPGRYA